MRNACRRERSDGHFRWGRRLSSKALQVLGVDKKRRQVPAHATYL
jgi:hypothetical protein